MARQKVSTKKPTAKKSKVSSPHAAYRLHSDQIAKDLLSGDNAKELQELFGEEVYEQLRALSAEAGRTRAISKT